MIKITAYKYHGVILTYSIDTKVFTERFLTCLILSYAPPWRIWSAFLLKKIASLYSFSIPKKQNMIESVIFTSYGQWKREHTKVSEMSLWYFSANHMQKSVGEFNNYNKITFVVLSNTSKQSGQEQVQQTIQLQQKRPSMFPTFSSPCPQLLHLKKIKQ